MLILNYFEIAVILLLYHVLINYRRRVDLTIKSLAIFSAVCLVWPLAVCAVLLGGLFLLGDFINKKINKFCKTVILKGKGGNN